MHDVLAESDTCVAVQAVHAEALWDDIVPAGHCVQTSVPGTNVPQKVPAAQSTQDDAEKRRCPTPHVLHVSWFDTLVTNGDAQSSQLLAWLYAQSLTMRLPAPQSMHVLHVASDVAPAVNEYFPAPHTVQEASDVIPAVPEYFPAGQLVHTFDVALTPSHAVLRYLPASQPEHAEHPALEPVEHPLEM